ncbi:hypothetical protein Salat_1185500 [Sesamum alatum]|uniref:Uncharacterized protein n=1 Tax=Sesamum alatum TaxID=300844 RepID=A0AAE2CNP2_9LAMI|nr:hypothetical protein Salat_1185500 [Sesamum alatum]
MDSSKPAVHLRKSKPKRDLQPLIWALVVTFCSRENFPPQVAANKGKTSYWDGDADQRAEGVGAPVESPARGSGCARASSTSQRVNNGRGASTIRLTDWFGERD